jgi:hypothetical protein
MNLKLDVIGTNGCIRKLQRTSAYPYAAIGTKRPGDAISAGRI